MTTVNTLVYKHFMHHQDIIEGITDHEIIRASYERWSKHCVITSIRPDYLKIVLPDKTNGRPVDHYADYEICKGLWIAYADYGEDVDQYYWCGSWLQALIKKWICRVSCSGPCLIHTIKI